MSEKKNRVGETALMSCGLNATIIEYRNANDIDVEFEDGSCRKGVVYSAFKSGQIKHLNKTSGKLAETRLQEVAQMKNGQNATIIEYRTSVDIDVQFEDGTIVTNRAYSDFQRREIANPNYTPPNAYVDRRIGETCLMTNGMVAKIIAYRTSTDIDIEFEDGTVRQHVRYVHFKSGKVSPVYVDERTQNDKMNRVGETKMMNCGLSCTITEYNNSHDINVKFEDGLTVTHKYYRDFLNGLIKHPNKFYCDANNKKETRTKTSTFKNCSTELNAKETNNVTAHQNEEQINVNQRSNRKAFSAGDLLGEEKIMNCGLKASLIAYRSSSDIDVQFEDGEIRYNVEYRAFREGSLIHPSRLPQNKSNARIGEINKMNNGHNAKIIAYHSWHDVDVEFDDGVVVKGQRYEKFKNGEIPHPDVKYKTAMSLQEFAIHYYLRNLGFRKIKQGEWEGRGFGRFELDFYNDGIKIAIEYDGGVHNKPGNLERDIRKNKKCKKLGIKLYRLRDPYCEPLNDANSIDYVLDRQKQLLAGLIDCKQELQTILNENNLEVDRDYIDFERDKDMIINEYNDTYINYYAKERVGQKTYSKSAKQSVIIIRYNSANDIDVQFENGEVRYGVSYTAFKRGQLPLPGQGRKEMKQTRLGEQKIMKNGMMAKIVSYHNASDIEVEFEDGVIVKNKDYEDFCKGTIGHPHKNNHLTPKDQRVGESKKMNSGHVATIIKYVSSKNIDVQFEDGSVRYGVDYHSFTAGRIAHPDEIVVKVFNAKKRLSETKAMNNGMQATIIAYHSSQDIDVQFEDGSIRKGVTYAQFKNGSVLPLSQTDEAIKQRRLGETKVMNDGEKATIVRYKSSKNIDVQFEDGEIVKNVKYNNFKNGSVRHPKNSNEALATKRVGETMIMGCGIEATIIAYRGHSDIDIEFADGTIRSNVRYGSFKDGQIAHPSQTKDHHQACRVGETKIMNNGRLAKIIKYNSYQDIDVQFEDGEIRHGVSYSYFQNGSIAHPNETVVSKVNNRVGETKIMNCGMNATIINYKNSHDIDVQFEDGEIRHSVQYRDFRSGILVHPNQLPKRKIKKGMSQENEN